MRIIKRKYEAMYYEGIFSREVANSQRNKNRLKVLLTYRQDGRLLEIGCGKGGFLYQAEKYYDVEGMDISQYAVDAIKPHFGDRVHMYNIEQRPLPDNDYQIVAVFNVLEHLCQPHKVVGKLYGALMKGGVLFGSVPNNFSIIGGGATRLSNFFDRTHKSTFTPDTWERIFRHAGFSKIHFFGEVTLGPNMCHYLNGRLWKYLSFNLMFLCEKDFGI